MKKRRLYLLLHLVIILLLPVNNLIADTQVEVISLQAGNFEHIQFKKIKPVRYSYHDDILQIDVDNSASFLMRAFDAVKKINRVNFEWRSEGRPKINNSSQEEKRQGDDAVFKLGLLIEANEVSFNPLLPPWMKRVRKLLKFPSENMIYLVADARHLPGEKWRNPYNKRVTMISVSSVETKQGWMKVSYQFKEPVSVVALWLMADGDNTNSNFTSYIKGIKIEQIVAAQH